MQKQNSSDKIYCVRYRFIVRQTKKAWKTVMWNGQTIWFPKSLCKNRKRIKQMEAPRWMLSHYGINGEIAF